MSEIVADLGSHGLASPARNVHVGSRCCQRWWSARRHRPGSRPVRLTAGILYVSSPSQPTGHPNADYNDRDIDDKVYLEVINSVIKGSIAQSRCSCREQITR